MGLNSQIVTFHTQIVKHEEEIAKLKSISSFLGLPHAPSSLSHSSQEKEGYQKNIII